MLFANFTKKFTFFSFWIIFIITIFFGQLLYPVNAATGINPLINFQGKSVKSNDVNVVEMMQP